MADATWLSLHDHVRDEFEHSESPCQVRFPIVISRLRTPSHLVARILLASLAAISVDDLQLLRNYCVVGNSSRASLVIRSNHHLHGIARAHETNYLYGVSDLALQSGGVSAYNESATPDLKGHGFSRAATIGKQRALAPEGFGAIARIRGISIRTRPTDNSLDAPKHTRPIARPDSTPYMAVLTLLMFDKPPERGRGRPRHTKKHETVL